MKNASHSSSVPRHEPAAKSWRTGEIAGAFAPDECRAVEIDVRRDRRSTAAIAVPAPPAMTR